MVSDMRAIDAEEFLKKSIEERRFFVYREDVLNDRFEVMTIYVDLINAVNEMPTIEPKQEWISVKDRPPEVEERVLVYSYEDGINFGYFLGYEDGFFIDCVYPNEPTHWMPLPEPPEKNNEEEQE
jgi:hypothetical protein